MARKKDLDVEFDLDGASVNVEKKPSPAVIEEAEEGASEELKRLTLDIPASLHRKLKILAMDQGVPMAKMIRVWFDQKTSL
jgi:hypothetical protein